MPCQKAHIHRRPALTAQGPVSPASPPPSPVSAASALPSPAARQPAASASALLLSKRSASRAGDGAELVRAGAWPGGTETTPAGGSDALPRVCSTPAAPSRGSLLIACAGSLGIVQGFPELADTGAAGTAR